MRCWIVAAVIATGCNKAPSCKDAIEKALGQLRSDSTEAATLIGVCEQQGWSADVRTCVAGSKSQPELAACMARDKKLAKAEAAAKDAEAAAKAAQDKVDKLTKELADVDAKLAGSGSGSGSSSGSDAGAGSAVAPDALRKQKVELEAKLAAAKAAAEKAARAKAQAAECAKNPSAKGC